MMNDKLDEKSNKVNNESNINESQIITQVNQLAPIPFNQFIIIELALIVPTVILLGLIYYSSKKEDNNG